METPDEDYIKHKLDKLDWDIKLLDKMFSKLDRNINLTKLTLPNVIEKPFQALYEMWEQLWGYLERILSLIILIGLVVIIVISTPLITFDNF